MKRRNFLTALVIGSVALVAQPLLAQTKDETDLDRFLRDIDTGKIKLVKPHGFPMSDLFTTPNGIKEQLEKRSAPHSPFGLFYVTTVTQTSFTLDHIYFDAAGKELSRSGGIVDWGSVYGSWRNLTGFTK